MVKDVLRNGTGRLSEDVTEDIVKLEVGNSQAILGAVLLPGEHVRELGAVAYQVAQLSYFRGWDKAGFYHVAHEEVADPLCVLTVSLITLLRFRVFWMGKCDKTGLFEDVKDWDPILASGFHADLKAGIFRKPVSQLPEAFGKGREAGLLIFGASIGVSDADAGIDPGFVDIKPTTVLTKDFKRQ